MAARTKKKTKTKNQHTVISALHQLVLKRNLGVFKLASADAHLILLDLTWVVECLKASDFFGSSFCEKESSAVTSLQDQSASFQVLVFSVVCNFLNYIFWFPAGDRKTWDIFLPFVLFLLSGFGLPKYSLLERVDGSKLFTDSSYDYLFSKRNLIFLSNISIHITWHHWQNFFLNKIK